MLFALKALIFGTNKWSLLLPISNAYFLALHLQLFGSRVCRHSYSDLQGMSNRNVPRARQLVTFANMMEMMKEHIPSAKDDWMYGSSNDVLENYEHFFLEIASRTSRINPICVAGCASKVLAIDPKRAKLFAQALCEAFTYCKKAGDNAKTGEKLTPACQHIYHKMTSALSDSHPQTWRTFSGKLEPAAAKIEPEATIKREMPPSSPAKKVKSESKFTCLMSPTAINRIYEKRVPVKVEKVIYMLHHTLFLFWTCSPGVNLPCRAKHARASFKGGLSVLLWRRLVEEACTHTYIYIYIYMGVSD